VLVTEGLEIGCRRRKRFNLTWRRRLVGGPGFEKMRVATLNSPISVGGKLAWK
jgi:hypothetical protein